MASSASSTLPYALITMTVASLPLAYNVAKRSSPPILSMRTSVSTTSRPKVSTSASACSPLSAVSTSYPCLFKSVRNTSRWFSSSSTTRTRRMVRKVYHVAHVKPQTLTVRRGAGTFPTTARAAKTRRGGAHAVFTPPVLPVILLVDENRDLLAGRAL